MALASTVTGTTLADDATGTRGPEEARTAPRAGVRVTAVVALFTALHVALLAATTAPIDDAAITYNYAHQAADGHPLGTVIPGDPVGEGWSNPTWMALQWAGEQVGISANAVGRGLGLLLAAATAAALAATALRLSPGRRTERLALLLAVGFVPAIWAASGLENALVGSLMVAVGLLIAREERRGARGWAACGSAVVAAVLAISRPEAPLYLGAALAAKAWSIRSVRRRGDHQSWVDLVRWAGVGAALVGAYLAWHLARFGFLFANPVYAKATEGSVLDRLTGALDPGNATWTSTVKWAAQGALLWLAPAVVLGALALRRLPERALLVMAVGALALPMAEADWMDHYRFYAAATGPLTLLAVLGTVELLRRRDVASADWARRYRMLVGFGLAVFLLFNLVTTAQLALNGNAPGVTTLDIADGYRPVRALGDRFGIADPLLLAPDAGATTYELEVRFLDAAGLLDTQVAHTLGDADRLQRYGFVERRPDLVFLHTDYALMWDLDADRLREWGYLTVPFEKDEDTEILLVAVRRDHVVAPDEEPTLRAPTIAEAGGTLIARGTWPASAAGEALEVELRAGGEVVASASGTIGDEVVDADDLETGEGIRSTTHVRLPEDLDDGRLELTARVGAVEQTVSVTVGDAVEVPPVDDDPIMAVQALADLRRAVPSAATTIDRMVDELRTRTLAELADEAEAHVEAADADRLEVIARTAAAVRGRHDPDDRWRAIADQALDQPGDRYVWARAAQLADPTSIDAARRLLDTRPPEVIAAPPS